MDKIRVLRIIEYVGMRDLVEDTVSRSIYGTKEMPNGIEVRVATIGSFPEILEQSDEEQSYKEELI